MTKLKKKAGTIAFPHNQTLFVAVRCMPLPIYGAIENSSEKHITTRKKCKKTKKTKKKVGWGAEEHKRNMSDAYHTSG